MIDALWCGIIESHHNASENLSWQLWRIETQYSSFPKSKHWQALNLDLTFQWKCRFQQPNDNSKNFMSMYESLETPSHIRRSFLVQSHWSILFVRNSKSVLPPSQVQNPQKQNPLWKLNVGNYDLEVYIFKLCQCKLNHMEMVERWVFAIRISNECFSWRRSCNRIHSSCVLQFQFVEIICVQLNPSFNTQSCCILSLSIDCVVESGEECSGWSCWHGSELAFERT